jgi:hypothetical protein
MRKPSPEILDLFYRSCGFPIDDLDVRDFVQHTSSVIASTWFVPTRTLPAVFFVMGGGSGDLSALIYELRRLAEITDITANALNIPSERRSPQQGLCYHYFVQVTHLDARIYGKSIEEWDDALTPLLHASVMHPWFKPLEQYAEVYKNGVICSATLPATNFGDLEAAEYLGDPDAPVAKRAGKPVSPPTFDEDDNADDLYGSEHGDDDDFGGDHPRAGGNNGRVSRRSDGANSGRDGNHSFDAQGLESLSGIKLSAADRKFLKMDEDADSVEDDL